MRVADREIFVTTSFAGWHAWPGAPAGRAYLAVAHRHLFEVTVSVPVAHDDRDIEFHDLLDVVKEAVDAISEWMADFNDPVSWSCEELAIKIGHSVGMALELSSVRVEVSEDGENGASVTMEAER